MVSLQELGLSEFGDDKETVTILVGPNGSGKSSALLEIARSHRRRRNIYIVCNTPHDRFAGLRGVPRISAANSSQTPKAVVKRAVVEALSGAGSEFYQISSILKHCGYAPQFGFMADRGRYFGSPLTSLALPVFDQQGEWRPPDPESEIGRAIEFLSRHAVDGPIWIDATQSAIEFSKAREFALVLKLEATLRNYGIITGIRVYLNKDFGGPQIEIKNASSGQLALISSLLYLITKVAEHPIIVIDEPENSLHPKWQQEYVEMILAAMRYRNASVILATHAPLVVTGALAHSPEIVSVFEVREGRLRRLDIDSSQPAKGIEELLWRAFDVVTPANHFVSEKIVDAISQFEKGNMQKVEVLQLINSLDDESFDERQKRYFQVVRGLVDEVDAAKAFNGESDA